MEKENKIIICKTKGKISKINLKQEQDIDNILNDFVKGLNLLDDYDHQQSYDFLQSYKVTLPLFLLM